MECKAISLESEAGFRVLFECATIGILVIDDKGLIELANPCAETLFGYKPAELIGKPIEVLIPETSVTSMSTTERAISTSLKPGPWDWE